MTRVETRPCGARYRPSVSGPGWVCDGTGLIQLMDGPVTLDGKVPVVCPESALSDFMAEECAAAYHPQPFAGGDHLHAVMPSRTTSAEDARDE